MAWELPPRPALPPDRLEEDGFVYIPDGITFRGIARACEADLEFLLYPDEIDSPVARKYSKKIARRHVGPDFIRAQLAFYGILPLAATTDAKAKMLLRRAVKHGKCDALSAHAAAVENRLRQKYVQLQADYAAAMRAYDQTLAAMRSQIEDHGTPMTEIAKSSFETFMTLFFSSPDAHPEPIVVPKFKLTHDDRCWMNANFDVQCAIYEAYDGARVFEHGTVVGWSRESVELAVGQSISKSMRQRVEELEKHHEVLNAKSGGDNPCPVGTYLIKSPGGTYGDGSPRFQWMHVRPTPTPGVYEAGFDFAGYSGAMLMGHDVTSLVNYRRELEEKDRWRGRGYIPMLPPSYLTDDESDSARSEDGGDGDGPALQAEQAGSSSQGWPCKRKKLPGGSPVVKKPKLITANLYEETALDFNYVVRSMARVRYGSSWYTEGSVLFEDRRYTRFEGKICLPHGLNCQEVSYDFVGIKTCSEIPSRKVRRTWGQYHWFGRLDD